MTDEELIQYLRTTPGWPTLGNAAADRIEALIRERDALTDALAEAEAERNFWKQAAAKGSIHTQADLDRAVDKARAEAYLSGWVNGSNGIEPPDFGNPAFEKAPGD